MAKRCLKYTTQDMHELAKTRGFNFLSNKYNGITVKHLWRCNQGHTWETTPSSIKNGNGCKKCAAAKLRTNIDDAYKIAHERGFRLVSNVYLGMNKKHEWMCEEGHVWRAVTGNIKFGNGCPRCNRLKKSISEEKCRFIFEYLTGMTFPSTRKHLEGRLELDGYCEKLNLAFEYQGQQHYDTQHYFNQINKSIKTQQEIDDEKKLICQKKGIRLILISHSKDVSKITRDIRQKLKGLNIKTNNNIDWDQFKSLPSLLKSIKTKILRRGIILISKTYLGSHSKHNFKCVKCHHKWKAVLKDVRDKSGCPKCAGNIRHSIEYIKNMCADFGILFLSNKYVSMNKKYSVKCQKCKHVWETQPNRIKNGKGCPKCAGNIKTNLRQFTEVLNKKNIKIINKYAGLSIKYNFSCNICNHIWKTTAMCIWHKTGCPNCANNNKKINIEKLRSLALKRNLKLLSTKCLGYYIKHSWECLCCKRHYELKPSNVQRGTSCRTCKLKKGGN